ncbi:DnaJ- protein scj1 [Puccinia graminis f. sp. tritici]|uniref:DnaJ-protein scj1 n=1 Tax=Puccinia graminis f. sp. tritici TaxID=56615 RepID=A0A5B0MKI4_PUCGR|nr:DnaJ- protein scj1 [Puccinia graminis f. sp. tritici]
MANSNYYHLEILSICLIILITASDIFALDPYKILGVSRKAESVDIRRAYRKLSKRWHPDKNPNNEEAHQKFLEISESWEILSDPETREIFDKRGEEGLKRHREGGDQSDGFDFFSQFFGGGGGGGRSSNSKKNAKKKGPTMATDMEVELEDIYIGRSIDFEISRRVLCPACKGNGARKETDIVECEKCQGQGVRIIRHQLGPGIFQQMQMQCDACSGRGQTIKHKCTQCHGERTVEEVNSLTLDIDRGSPDGHEEVFEGEGDEGPGYSAGDVLLRIRIKKQSDGGFRRLEENLYWKEVLSLDEALLGFTRKIKHLDGHDLTVSRQAVTQPGFVEVIEGEGMPRHQALGYGNLFIEFAVVFPMEVSGPFRAGQHLFFLRFRRFDQLILAEVVFLVVGLEKVFKPYRTLGDLANEEKIEKVKSKDEDHQEL